MISEKILMFLAIVLKASTGNHGMPEKARYIQNSTAGMQKVSLYQKRNLQVERMQLS